MFTNKGFINIQFLHKFPLFYSDIFTPENFLDILRELLAIADMKNEIYFMPSLLKELSENEVKSYRCNSKLLSPLLLYLDGGCLPNGLFTSLIAALNNDHNWSPSLIDEEPACLYRNCVEFSIPGGVPGSVTLIASFECIEIQIDCMFESELADICHRVFDDVKNGLEASWKVCILVISPSRQPSFVTALLLIASINLLSPNVVNMKPAQLTQAMECILNQIKSNTGCRS